MALEEGSGPGSGVRSSPCHAATFGRGFRGFPRLLPPFTTPAPPRTHVDAGPLSPGWEAIQTERAQITRARGFVGGREVRSGSGVQPCQGRDDPAHACARSRRRRRDTGRYSGPACSAQGHALRTPTRGGRTLSEPQKPALVRDSSRLLADGGVSGSSVHVRARETAAACSLGAPSPR